jgi:hypothetical protein
MEGSVSRRKLSQRVWAAHGEGQVGRSYPASGTREAKPPSPRKRRRRRKAEKPTRARKARYTRA